jgi:hypothetical protein
VAQVTERVFELLPMARRARLAESSTIDLDTTDVEVYGRKKRGMDYNHQGQRCGRPHVATWAEMETCLSAELFSGNDDARASAPDVFVRALAALPRGVRCGRVRLRADTGYFDGKLARIAFLEGVEFAIGAKRIAPLWRLLAGLSEKDWADAVGMDGAQVAVSSYRPAWWPSKTEILIRRVKLDISQVSADSRSRRRRTLHPDQRALPLGELAKAGDIYAYSFVCTNIDMSTPGKAVAVEYWYRQRTTTREHLPGQQARCRTTSSAQWLSGSQHRLDAALLAANMAAWVHELTGTLGGGGETVTGHGPWRQGHDRHSSPPAHPRSRPPDQPRGAAHTQASAGS